MTRARTGAVIIAATVIVISLLTLTPAIGGDQASRWCIVCGRRVLGDVLLNIALFIPLGFGLALLGIPRRRALAIILLATVAIELAQGLFLRGRFASLSDVVTNTAGGLTGYALAAHWRTLVFPSRHAAARLGGGLLAAWLAIIAFSAWALTPPLREGTYRTILPEADGASTAGFVRTAELYRTLDDNEPLKDSASIARALHHREVLLLTRFDPPLPADDVVAAVRRAESVPVITIAHGRGIAVLTVHSPARSFFLYEPTIFSGPVDSLPRAADSLVTIAGGLDGAEVRMFFLRDSTVVMEGRLPIVPALWPYLLVGHGPAPGFLVPFSALLNALLLAPSAFWLWSAATGGAPERRRRSALGAIATIAAALVLGYAGIPAAARLVETPLEVWLVSAAALIAGAVAAEVAVRFAPRQRQAVFPS